MRHPEIDSYYVEVKYELQNKRCPIICMTIIRPKADDKKSKNQQLYNVQIKDLIEK